MPVSRFRPPARATKLLSGAGFPPYIRSVKACWRQALLIASLFWFGGLFPALANTTEKGAFNSATEAFSGAFYARAESEFATYIQQFTNSTRIPEAILMQARARIELTNYAGAVELLTTQLPQAGRLLDQYLFWLGDAHFRNGAYDKAAEQFRAVITQNPNSSRLLEAAMGEAAARARLGEWGQVAQLLGPTNSVFQTAVAGRQADELSAPGFLLLSEALLLQGNPAGAEAALQPILKLPLNPRLVWQRSYLLSRIEAGRDRLTEALASTTNVLTLAAATADRGLVAETAAFQATVYERLGRIDEAIEAYERNLAEGFPRDRQQQALARLTELALQHDKLPKAAQILERFAARPPETPGKDLGLLTLAEVRLRQHLTATNAPPATNPPLLQAITALTNLVQEFPNSSFLGKAQLNLGWCRWLENRMPEARAAFQGAAERLPLSADRATALFKLADTQFRLQDYAGAITNYTAVANEFGHLTEVMNSLVEPALYQLVRASVAGGDLETAGKALARILESYPTGYHADRAVLFTSQTLAARGDPARAREILLEFAKASQGSPLMPQVQMAIANTYEREGHWAEVIYVYDAWLNQYTNSPLLAEAEYRRAWANFQAGRETNAYSQFGTFITQFPRHERAPLAQWWIADYYFRNGQYPEAEKNYQLLFQNTNWAGSTLAYEARMMAGRTAVMRSGWKDATDYFTNLTSDVKCPPDLRARALFAYGDVLMLQDSTNKVADYEQAIGVFNTIAESFATNEIAVLAIGQKASCLLQWANASQQYEPALKEFQKLTNSPLANVTVRSIARVGMGTVLEKQAQQKPGAERAALLAAALNCYLDVFFFEKEVREGERPDPFWVKRAGWEAARLAEQTQNWNQALRVYERLRDLLPALRGSLDRKIAKASEQLARARS